MSCDRILAKRVGERGKIATVLNLNQILYGFYIGADSSSRPLHDMLHKSPLRPGVYVKTRQNLLYRTRFRSLMNFKQAYAPYLLPIGQSILVNLWHVIQIDRESRRVALQMVDGSLQWLMISRRRFKGFENRVLRGTGLCQKCSIYRRDTLRS